MVDKVASFFRDCPLKVIEKALDADSLNQLLRRLPYRHPALLVDRITYIEPRRFLAATKNITRNESGFAGNIANHYYPSTLILESMIQATTILALHEYSNTEYAENQNILSGLQEVEFHKPVVAGDQLLLSIEAKTQKPYIWLFEASASTEEYVVANAKIALHAA